MNLKIIQGDALSELSKLPDQSVQCCVTSPPYWGLRDYGVAGQLGLESTPQEYVDKLVAVFREVKRVLRDDGTLWLNLGDSYAGSGKARGGGGCGPTSTKQLTNRGAYFEVSKSKRIERGNGRWGGGNNLAIGCKPKDLIGIPWMVAFALRNDGWYLRSDVIWAKPNPMPESVLDRPTRSHEYIFLLSKSERYFYDAAAISEPGNSINRNGFRGEFDGPSHYVNQPPHPDNSTRFESESAKRRVDKQRGHSRRHDGFNDRWDQMERDEQCSGMRNKRDVWTISPAQFPEAHFATFPPDLIKPCILAGSKPGDTILDPFFGSGTSGMVALELGLKCIGIELNPDYCKLAQERCNVTQGFTFSSSPSLPTASAAFPAPSEARPEQASLLEVPSGRQRDRSSS